MAKTICFSWPSNWALRSRKPRLQRWQQAYCGVSLISFLAVNGYDLAMPDDTLLGRMIEAVLTHEMSEEELADHIDHYVVQR